QLHRIHRPYALGCSGPRGLANAARSELCRRHRGPAALWQRHAARRHPLALDCQCEWARRAHPGGRRGGPARAPAAAWLPGARLLPLAAAGYHVIAPDQRGYGRTTGWDGSYDADPDPFRMLNMVRDALALVLALGHRQVAAVIGRDAGAPVAAWSALI